MIAGLLLGACVASLVLGGCTRSNHATDGGDDALEANATVERVVDGDTVVVDVDGTRERVRLIGIDTPESVKKGSPVECFGKEASKHLASLAPVGTSVRLERDAEERDRYGRTLAYVYRAADGLFLNLQMVSDGYAHVLSIPPNVSYADRFRDAERSARTANLGLWASCPDDETSGG